MAADKGRQFVLADVFATEKGWADEEQPEVAFLYGLLNFLMPLLTGQNVSVLPAQEVEVLASAELLVEFGEKLLRQFPVIVCVGEKVANFAPFAAR